MPLSPTAAARALQVFCDPVSADFAGYPETEAAAREAWADALVSYFSDLTNPLGLTAEHLEAARGVFFEASVGLSSTAGLTVLSTACQVFAASVAASMVTLGFVGTPPAAPLVFPPTPNPTAEAGCNVYGQTLDTWARSGTAAIPPATPVAWS